MIEMSEAIVTAPVRLPSVAGLLAAQIRYQFKLLISTPSALLIGVGFPVILLVTSDIRHARLAVAAVAGFAAFGVTVTAFNTHGVRMVAARESGILRRWHAAPLPRWCYFVGRIASVALFATLAGALTVAVAATFYHLPLTVEAAASVLIAFLLGSCAWAAAATVLASLVPVVEAASPIFIAAYFPTVIVSGLLGGITDEPRWLSTLADYLPARPLVDAAGYALAHTSATGVALPGRDVIVLATWAVVGLIGAAIMFRWEPRRPSQSRRPLRSAVPKAGIHAKLSWNARAGCR
jgi:ABC-2 type transport system permease protein